MSVLYYGIFSAAHFQTLKSVCRRLMKYPKVFIDTCCSNRQYLASKPKKVFVDKILEVRRGKSPIIKYRHFFASLNKLSKWEKICVCTNNGRLGLYGRQKDKKSTVAFCGVQQLQWSVPYWQAYTTLAEAVWPIAVEQCNNRQVLFFYTIGALRLWRPTILPLLYWLSQQETAQLVSKAYLCCCLA